MKKIVALAIVGLLSAGASYAQQKQQPAALSPSTPDFFPSSKTLPQFLSDGWEVKNGEAPGFGTISVFLAKGHDFTVCFLSSTDPRTNKKSDSAMFSTCLTTVH